MNNDRRYKKQEIAFKVEVKRGVVEKIHNAYIYQPKVCFKGGTVIWHNDKKSPVCREEK